MPIVDVFRAPRLVAIALSVGLTVPSAALAAPANDVERMYTQGQEKLEARDYTAAADVWTRLLGALEENADNRAIRETVILNLIEAHLLAYNLLVDEEGKKDVAHLRRAEATLREYIATFNGVYGEGVALSVDISQKHEELRDVLDRLSAKPPPPHPDPDPDPDPPPPPPPPARDNAGVGLIAGGAVVTAVGLGALAMIPVGSVRGKRSGAAYSDAAIRLDADPNDPGAHQDRVKALHDGEQANAILIAGAVLAPLLIAGGATMIGLGAKKRIHGHARLTPSIDRGFVGATLTGRF